MAVARKTWPEPANLCEAQLEVPAALLEALHEREAVCGGDGFAQDMTFRRAQVVPPERLISPCAPPSIDAFAELLRRLEEVSIEFADPDREEYDRDDFRGEPLGHGAQLWEACMPPRGAPGRGDALGTYKDWVHAIRRSIPKLRYVYKGSGSRVVNATALEADILLMPYYGENVPDPLPDSFNPGDYEAYELVGPVGRVAPRSRVSVPAHGESSFKFAVILDYGPYFAYGRTSHG